MSLSIFKKDILGTNIVAYRRLSRGNRPLKEEGIVKIEIYDPAMCCSSGLCGPAIDPVLVKVNDAIIALKKQNVEVERFNLAQQTKLFMENKTVADLLHNGGKKVLPITFVNGTVFKTGEYPSYEDLCAALGIEPLKTKPIMLHAG